MGLIPGKYIAGDTIAISYTDSNYPPDVWASTLTLRNKDEFYTIAGADGGDGSHSIEANGLVTALWKPADYTYYLTMKNGAARDTVKSGTVTVVADPSLGKTDDRSHVKRSLDLIEAVIEGRIPQDTISYSIQGRSISKMAPDELVMLHDRYKRFWAKEQRDNAAASGLPQSNKIKVRFR